MADEISAEVLLLNQKFLASTKETTGELTKLGGRFDAVFAELGAKAEAGVSAVVAELRKLDAKFAKTVGDAEAKAASARFDRLAEGFKAIGDQSGQLFNAAIGGGAKYESTINKIRAISDLTAADIEQLGANLDDLGKRFGFAVGPTESAEIALQAVGSGFESVAQSTQITQSALALIADKTTSADAATKLLTGTLNAYGLGADQAAKLTDVFFQIQNRGVVSIAEMSNSLGLVTKVAAEAGISYNELGAAVIVATKNNVPFTSSVEGMRGLISSLQNPTDEAEKAMLKYGLSVNYATLRQKGLGGTLREIKEAVGDDAQAFRDIVGPQQAFALASALAGDNLAAFTQELRGLENSTGAAARSTRILSEGFENRSQAFAAAAERLQVSVTKNVLPLATQFVNFATRIVDAGSKLPEPIKTFGVVALGAAAGLGVLAGGALALKGTLALLGVEAVGIVGAIGSAGGSLRNLLAFDVAKLVPTRDGIRAVGVAVKDLATRGITSLNSNFAALFPTFTQFTGLTGSMTLGLGALVVGLGAVIKGLIDMKFAAEDAALEASKAQRGYAAFGKEVTEIRVEDALSMDAASLTNIGITGRDIRNKIFQERSKADNETDQAARDRRLQTIQLLKAKEKELDDYVASLGAKEQQAIRTAAQEKEAYQDALQRIQLSKDDAEAKATQLRGLIGQYRLVGDERRRVEQLVAQEEDKAAKKRTSQAEKDRAESVKQSVQEIENSKKSKDQKIKDLKAVLDTAKVNGDERRSIEDKILRYEQSLLAERQKIAERQKQIQLEASEEKVKTAERELERLRDLQEKGVDTSAEQTQQLRVRADEQKRQVDTRLEKDLLGESDASNREDLKRNAEREKRDIEQAAQDAMLDVVDQGIRDKLQRLQQGAQQEADVAKRRLDLLSKLERPPSDFQIQQAAGDRLKFLLQEIELQKQLTLAQTKDPSQIAQAERLAQQQILDAKVQVREEVEATTRAIEEQQKKTRRQSSQEFSGNILTLEQFLKGEQERFTTKSAEEFFGKPINLPGLNDVRSQFELQDAMQRELSRDPARAASRNAALAGADAAKAGLSVAIEGRFVLVDQNGEERGRLDRLTVNGRNSELNSETRNLGL